MPAIDTLKLKTRLSESGMLEPQAQALVEELDEALSKAINQEIATKADIAELQGTLKADIAELQGTVQSLNERLQGENKFLRWMITATLIIVVAIGIRPLFM